MKGGGARLGARKHRGMAVAAAALVTALPAMGPTLERLQEMS
jgi:hypothetical protein